MREILAIGVISGTSADGIDAAALLTDGVQVTRTLGGVTVPYAEYLRAEVLSLMAAPERVRNANLTKVESAITAAHVAAVEHLIAVLELSFADIGVVGFHGQTVLHRPADGFSRQLFDGAAAARRLGLPVVADFRTADMAAGGEGAPLAPIYHAARAAGGVRPMAVLNLGGIGNLTWLGADERLVAFDTGPANALLDDWVRAAGRGDFDRDGALARAGRVDTAVLRRLMADPYFTRPPPKSLDRYDIAPAGLYADLSPADGAATLTAFSAAAVAHALAQVPQPPDRLWVCGGGRRNPALMAAIAAAAGVTAAPVEDLGWDGDLLEAELFGFLAVRRLAGLAITFPETTGVAAPTMGGVVFDLASVG